MELNITKANLASHADILYETVQRHFASNRMHKCLTYDPPGPTPSGLGLDSQVEFRLETKGVSNWLAKLHNPGSFRPGMARTYGGDFVVSPLSVDGHSMIGAYTVDMTVANYLNERGWICDASERCLLQLKRLYI